jgi:hypothetical protein
VCVCVSQTRANPIGSIIIIGIVIYLSFHPIHRSTRMPITVSADKLPYLQEWLTDRLDPITDAEPGTLAEYVLALLKHEKDGDALMHHCSTQLEDFLRENTQSFVQNLFQAIQGWLFFGGMLDIFLYYTIFDCLAYRRELCEYSWRRRYWRLPGRRGESSYAFLWHRLRDQIRIDLLLFVTHVGRWSSPDRIVP